MFVWLIFAVVFVLFYVVAQDFPFALIMEDDVQALHPGLPEFLCKLAQRALRGAVPGQENGVGGRVDEENEGSINSNISRRVLGSHRCEDTKTDTTIRPFGCPGTTPWMVCVIRGTLG